MKIIVFLFVALLFFAGCAQQQAPLTQEEREMQLAVQQAFINQFTSSAPTPVREPQRAQIQRSEVEITESELGEKINAIAPSEGGVNISRERDGLRIGNSIYLDPEGEIIDVGVNALSGEFSYFIPNDNNQLVLKYSNVNANGETVHIGEATNRNGTWYFRSVTGENLTGTRLIPTSRGLIVTRGSSAFSYVAGVGVSSIAAPDGYRVANFQNGDVASTGYILVEKIRHREEGAAGLMRSLRGLGNSFGVVTVDDYALVGFASEKIYMLDLNADAKDVAVHRGCSRQNSVVNRCDSVSFKASLYDQNGLKNNGHYFWNIYWFETENGPFSVTRESGSRRVIMRNLANGKEVVLFERNLGISDFYATQSHDGTIQVEVSMAFRQHRIDDAMKHYLENISM